MRFPVTEASKGWQFCTTCRSLRDLHNPDTSTIGYELRASTLTHAHSEQRCEVNPLPYSVLAMSSKTAIGGFGGDWGRWLALASLGLLPRKWKAPVAIAAILRGLRG